jgi:hypothetical protein
MNTTSTDKYLLIFRSTDWYEGLSPEELEKIMTKWGAWFQRLSAEGVVESGSPLAAEGRIVSGKEGTVSDGPFAEAKETIGGYFLLNARSIEDALAVAKECPGLPYGVRVEVRPVATMCPIAAKIGMDPKAMAAVA